jgi:protein-tyrosine-phosphatase
MLAGAKRQKLSQITPRKGTISCIKRWHDVSRQSKPVVIEVMKERKSDISKNKPKLLTTQTVQEADQIVTMDCSVEKLCPAPFLKNVIDWD